MGASTSTELLKKSPKATLNIMAIAIFESSKKLQILTKMLCLIQNNTTQHVPRIDLKCHAMGGIGLGFHLQPGHLLITTTLRLTNCTTLILAS
jgi:hypothetical protein